MNDARYDLLRQSVIDAPVVMKGDYAYFIHPLSDGVPQQSAELLAAARDLIHEQVDWNNVDIILGIEAMGIPLATALSLASGKPLVVGRKRTYGLPGEFAIDQTTGYSKGEIYLNDIKKGDRILLVDDVVSTGGTLLPILKGIDEIQAIVADCWIIFEKGEGMNFVRNQGDWPLNSLVRIKMDGEKVALLD
ncbi:MAG: hypoxanthine/guanine phosphoribosyltransferase [Candidatus Poseidoniaceae archaeon]